MCLHMIPPNDFEGCKKSNLPSTDCFEINTSQQSISAFWDGKNVHQNKSLKTRGTTRIETPRRISTHSTNNGVTRMSLPLIIVSTHQLRNVLLFTASARRSQSMTPLPVVKSLHKQSFPSIALPCIVAQRENVSSTLEKFPPAKFTFNILIRRGCLILLFRYSKA